MGVVLAAINDLKASQEAMKVQIQEIANRDVPAAPTSGRSRYRRQNVRPYKLVSLLFLCIFYLLSFSLFLPEKIRKLLFVIFLFIIFPTHLCLFVFPPFPFLSETPGHSVCGSNDNRRGFESHSLLEKSPVRNATSA